MTHLTAGDITPIGHIAENTYGTTPGGTYTYYGDVREGGNVTPTDNPNPNLSWRYTADGKKTYDAGDYVTQQQDAGFTDAIEVRDQAAWYQVLAYGGISSSSTPLASLGSRTVQVGYQKPGGEEYALTYVGCKTDQLKVSADVPGGIVAVDETVLASYRDPGTTTFTTEPVEASAPAVQWVGGVTLAGVTVYPQSFALSIRNNLGRVQAYDTDLAKSVSIALTEGRQEMELEMTLWMEDFSLMLANMDNASAVAVTLTLGLYNPVTLTGTARYMADGTNTGLIQDKQTQTVRLRLTSLYYTVG